MDRTKIEKVSKVQEVNKPLDTSRQSFRDGSKEVLSYIQKPLRDFYANSHGGSLPDHMENLQFSIDKHGKAYMQENDITREINIKDLEKGNELRYAQLEQDIKKNALAETLKEHKVFVEDAKDLSGLKINNGVYSFTDRDGTRYEISRKNFEGNEENFDKIRKDVEAKITTLGFKVDSMPMPDPVEKDFLKRVASKETDLASKTAIENGTIYNYRYDSNTDRLALNITPRVEHENSSGAKEIKDGEMKEFSIDLKTLLPEEKTILIDQVKKHFVEEQIKKDIEGTGGKFVDGSLTIEGDKYSYENQDGVLKGKLHGEQKEDLEKYLSSLGLGDKKAPVSEAEAEAKLRPKDNFDAPGLTNQAEIAIEKPKNEVDDIQKLQADKKKFDRDHKRMNNFLMGLRVANDSALQSSQMVEAVLIDKLLQTEDTGSQQMPPGSMFSQGIVDRHHEHGRRQSKVKQKYIEFAKNQQKSEEEKNEADDHFKSLKRARENDTDHNEGNDSKRYKSNEKLGNKE